MITLSKMSRSNTLVQLRLDLSIDLLVIKLQRAHGGCLGAKGRRRTQQAAKRFGEVQATYDPEISEWGNPACDARHSYLNI